MNQTPPDELLPWPGGDLQRMLQVHGIVMQAGDWVTTESVAARFREAPPEVVTGILNYLVWLGKCEWDGARYRALPD